MVQDEATAEESHQGFARERAYAMPLGGITQEAEGNIVGIFVQSAFAGATAIPGKTGRNDKVVVPVVDAHGSFGIEHGA